MGGWVSYLQAGGSMVAPLLLASVVSVGLIIELTWTLSQAKRGASRENGDTWLAAIERRVSWLGLIAAIAPLLGLIGTVFGMIRIFHQVSLEQPANPIAALSGGISEALVATAGGLIVAVIAAMGQHSLQLSVEALAERGGHAGQ